MSKKEQPDEPTRLRLNQAIAKTGFCSRRKADELIAAGAVAVNGQVITDFSRLIDTQSDVLSVEGQPLSFKRLTYVLLNKPAGIVTTMRDEQGRKTVVDLLPASLRHLKPVGRLDMYSEGLLILTNDGELALQLTHPRKHVAKVYSVLVRGQVTESDLHLIRAGVPLEDGVTLPARATVTKRNKTSTEVRITIVEGRNRQIRRMFDYLGYPITRLVRLAIGGLQLGQVAPGTWRYLTSQEVSDLLSQTMKTHDA